MLRRQAPADTSAGCESVAEVFRAAREPARIGAATVAAWARQLPAGATVLDLGCGAGEPVALELARAGCAVWGIDASPTLLRTFRQRFPHAPVACEDITTSMFFDRTFDAAVAIGVLFLLPPEAQRRLLRRVAAALVPGGAFLFTAPAAASSWPDLLTGQRSESLGASAYRALLAEAGLTVVREAEDEGANHHFFAHRDRQASRRAARRAPARS